MGPQYFWCGGMWFFPVIMLILMFLCMYLFFGRGCFRSSCHDSSRANNKEGESALEALKKRYAKGEITKAEYEEIKRDIDV